MTRATVFLCDNDDMQIENEVFRKSHPVISKLKAFGFEKKEDRYVFRRNIMDDAFEVRLAIDGKGTAEGKIFDNDFGDEYTSFRYDYQATGYVSQVREAYIGLLEEIRKNCFKEDPYLSGQTSRIVNHIRKQYADKPEHLWKSYPDYQVFRSKTSGKWYGIIMNVDGKKVGLNKGEVEIIDVKLDPSMIEALKDRKGYHEAYHMNKQNWITVILNDSIEDEVIYSLIDYSHSQVEVSESWIIPANPEYYDVIHCFDKTDTVLWKQSSAIHPGDIVYMYVAAPYSAVLYKCMATETDIPYEYRDRNVRMSHVMRLKLIKKYARDRYPFAYLNSIGIRAIRGPRKLPKDVSFE